MFAVPTLVALTGVCVFFVALFIKSKAKLNRDGKDYDNFTNFSLLKNNDSVLKADGVHASVTNYENLFDGARKSTGSITTEESINKRKAEYGTMVSSFYDLVTDFYEYGWGQSFHFAPRFINETFLESIKRVEYFLAGKLRINQKSLVLDCGCGVGGPMRNIARFSGAKVEGVTINDYQVKVGNKYNKMFGLETQCRSQQGDFQSLAGIPKDAFDAAYQIEATCHSPNRVQAFSAIGACLKQGGLFAGLEWVVLENYKSSNKDHVRIKEGIEVGNGLPTLVTPDVIVKNLEDAGFEVIEHYDLNRNLHAKQEIPWYATLNGSMTLSGFRMTRLGRMCTHSIITLLEFLKIAPKGSIKVSQLLNDTADDLVEGGQMQIFTPSYYFLARKL